MRFRRFASLPLLVAPLLLVGCGEKATLDPPKLNLGQQECEECRMIVSEERFAAAAVLVRDGETLKLVFDDVGCLIDWIGKSADREACIAYVHDYDTLGWLDARKAYFIRSDELRTPMASHVAALGDDAAAKKLLSRYPGKRVSWAELRGK